MQLLLAILLYLRIIVAPGTYTDKHIRCVADTNREKIDAVRNDKPTMDLIQRDYIPQTDGIIIIQSETD
jgi:hypothetical protein